MFKNANSSADRNESNLEIDLGGDDIGAEGNEEEDDGEGDADSNGEGDDTDDGAGAGAGEGKGEAQLHGGDNINVDCIMSTTGKKIKCRLAAVNQLCFVDVNAKGREILEKMNPAVTRFRKRKRSDRKNQFLESVFDDYNAVDDNECVDLAFSRFLNKLN